jgi:hypothetical protein
MLVNVSRKKPAPGGSPSIQLEGGTATMLERRFLDLFRFLFLRLEAELEFELESSELSSELSAVASDSLASLLR